MQKAKWLSEEDLIIAEKRREVNGKEEKERYTHLNAEFQRIARRDKKAFHSDQCKEIEDNNRIGKTRDLFKKIRNTKGTFHAKMGSIKNRNGMDLIESESEVAQLCLTLCDPIDCSYQAPVSMGFSRQEYWSGLPFPSPGDLPNPGINPRSSALQADSLPTELQGKHPNCIHVSHS